MLLDLGCGRSPYKRLADGFAVKWIAADIRNSGGADILLDAQKLPFKDKVFDTVLCTQILEYLPDFFVASEEIHRILKPQGMAIISNPAVLPPFGGARWRIMPEGYMTMLSKFSVCEVDGDCKTVAGFFRIINLYMAIILQEVPVLEAIWRLSICPIFNLIGSWANRRFKDVGFAANYIVIARK
jgi:SAM-dependent methyltransferase